MKESNLEVKSYDLSLSIVKCVVKLIKGGEYHLSKQLLKSATSIGANIQEAIGAYSKREFRSKLSIAYKEARETKYWLRLLNDSGYLSEDEFKSFYDQTDHLSAILFKILRSSKEPSK